MKTVHYCEKCNKPFSDWKECSDHEQTHPSVEKVVSVFSCPDDSMPASLTVEFSNGFVTVYSYKETKESPQKEKSPDNEA